MKKEFKPIAMKCNQEQFYDIKKKLETIYAIDCFQTNPYLINNLSAENGLVSNVDKDKSRDYGREVHETWNEKIFLEACGIEVEETFVITKELLLQIHSESKPIIKGVIELSFPSAFEHEKKELVVEAGKWYKYEKDKFLVYIEEIKDDYFYAYGFNNIGNWGGLRMCYKTILGDFTERINNELTEATQQEVEEALKAEILKRYKVGDRVNCLKCGNVSLNRELNLDSFDHYFEDDQMWVSFDEGEKTDSMVCVYSNGIFAEIIQPKKMTKAEIETELGYNIEIV